MYSFCVLSPIPSFKSLIESESFVSESYSLYLPPVSLLSPVCDDTISAVLFFFVGQTLVRPSSDMKDDYRFSFHQHGGRGDSEMLKIGICT